MWLICSITLEHAHPRVIAAWLRERSSIENAVRSIHDVTFDEDRSTMRTSTHTRSWPAYENAALDLRRPRRLRRHSRTYPLHAFSANHASTSQEPPNEQVASG